MICPKCGAEMDINDRIDDKLRTLITKTAIAVVLLAAMCIWSLSEAGLI